MFEIHWGLPVIGYLFLAGVGAGAYTVSASVLLRGGGGGFGGDHFNIARYGALLAPFPLMLGTGMIIFELGTFQAAVAQGDIGLFFRWINLFLTINLSSKRKAFAKLKKAAIKARRVCRRNVDDAYGNILETSKVITSVGYLAALDGRLAKTADDIAGKSVKDAQALIKKLTFQVWSAPIEWSTMNVSA